MIRATEITRGSAPAAAYVTLTYEDRLRRRIAMTADDGTAFLLDLAEVTELNDGDHLLLEDGRTIAIRAADEALMEVRARDPLHLVRTAWHVGNRHLPAQILPDRLILRADHVIAEMLVGLGCEVTQVTGPFTPEGGAYGHGRTHGHQH